MLELYFYNTQPKLKCSKNKINIFQFWKWISISEHLKTHNLWIYSIFLCLHYKQKSNDFILSVLNMFWYKFFPSSNQDCDLGTETYKSLLNMQCHV